MSVSQGVRALLYCLAIAITTSCGTRIVAPDTNGSLASDGNQKKTTNPLPAPFVIGDDNRKLSRKHQSALTLPDKRQFAFKGPLLNRQPRIAELRRIGVLAPDERVATEFHELPLFFASRSHNDKREFNFIARGLRFTMFLTPNEIVSVVGQTGPVKGRGANSRDEAFTGDAIHLKFLKAAAVKPRGEILTKAKLNRILGANSDQWSLGQPLYAAVSYRDLYPGINLFVHGSSGRPAFAFQIGPGAEVENIQLQYTGAKSLELDAEGNLIIGTSRGPIVNTTPRFFEIIDGKLSPLKGELLLADNYTFSYRVEGRTPGSTVVIDPEIIFASYFGGSLQEGGGGLELRARDFIGRGFDIDVGERGNLFVAGETVSGVVVHRIFMPTDLVIAF